MKIPYRDGCDSAPEVDSVGKDQAAAFLLLLAYLLNYEWAKPREAVSPAQGSLPESGPQKQCAGGRRVVKCECHSACPTYQSEHRQGLSDRCKGIKNDSNTIATITYFS